MLAYSISLFSEQAKNAGLESPWEGKQNPSRPSRELSRLNTIHHAVSYKLNIITNTLFSLPIYDKWSVSTGENIKNREKSSMDALTLR